MKQSLCDVCLAAAVLLAAPASGWPSGWPVTNAVPHWDVYDGRHDLRTVVAVGLMRIPRDYRLPRTEDMLLAYANEHRIPISNMVNVAQTVAEEGFAMLESGSITNKEESAAVMRYCGILMGFMGCTKAPSALPYLQSRSVNENYDIREIASQGIINILGADATSFLRKAEQDGAHEKNEFYSLYKTFVGRLKAENKTLPEVTKAKAYVFLLELAETEGYGDTVQMIDEVLCETLNGYSTSFQRERVAERMLRTGPDYSRPHFAAIREEIEKTPKEKRKDFRNKGDLLDPDRKRAGTAP